MAKLSSETVRSQFPALYKLIDGRPAAFLDGPAGTQVPEPVIRAVADYLVRHNANTHGAFATSIETDAVLRDARGRMADFLGARTADEIVFGANMTTLTFLFARGLAADWGRGDEIVVTRLDHQANVAPWMRAARERGITVHAVPFDPETVTLDYAALESRISASTRLVAIGHASNAVGTINDIRRVARAAHDVGALCYVDAVHSAPHVAIDVEELGCDFLVCSAYKFFGPHVGILWGRREYLERYSPVRVPPSPDVAPERWETGTLNHEGIAGTAAAVDWIAGLAAAETGDSRRDRILRAMRAIEDHETALFDQLLEGLATLSGVRVYGPPAGHPHTPTVAFTVGDLDSRQVAARLARRGIFAWSGDFYASTVVEDLGLARRGGLVRIGVAPYNTTDEIDRLLQGLADLGG